MEKNKSNFHNAQVYRLFQKYSVFMVLIMLVIIASLLSPAFLSYTNIMNVLRQISTNAILSLGLLLVIITGGIDISIGSIVGVSSVLLATLFAPDQAAGPFGFIVKGLGHFVTPTISGLIISILFILIIGALMGAFNGVIICKAKVQPFIMTIGTLTLYRGVALLMTDGLLVYMDDKVCGLVEGLGKGKILLDIPNQLYVLAFFALVTAFILRKMVFGRCLKAIGGNQESARLSGINVDYHKILVYIICGTFAAAAGILAAARTTCGDPNLGSGYEMNAIAACVIGGASLTGGKGNVIGTLCGVLIIGIINNMMNLADISTYYQYIVRGGIVILAVAFNSKGRNV